MGCDFRKRAEEPLHDAALCSEVLSSPLSGGLLTPRRLLHHRSIGWVKGGSPLRLPRSCARSALGPAYIFVFSDVALLQIVPCHCGAVTVGWVLRMYFLFAQHVAASLWAVCGRVGFSDFDIVATCAVPLWGGYGRVVCGDVVFFLKCAV